MIKIPKLKANDIEVRIKQVKANNKGNIYANLLIYKNSRIDMKILDEVFGVFGWSRRHKDIKGSLYCVVSIYDADKKIWIDKEDVGTAGEYAVEKSEASDSFKRACVNVGIGRELYTAPRIGVQLKENEVTRDNNKIKAKPSVIFKVESINYNENDEIDKLVIVDTTGAVRFSYIKE